jgi:hypothetical protein
VRSSCLALTIAENGGTGERLDMLCGRFVVSLTHERLLRNYLPSRLLVSAAERSTATAQPGTGAQLAAATLMRMESASADLGRHAMLKALSTAMFALTLRLASESQCCRLAEAVGASALRSTGIVISLRWKGEQSRPEQCQCFGPPLVGATLLG